MVQADIEALAQGLDERRRRVVLLVSLHDRQNDVAIAPARQPSVVQLQPTALTQQPS